VDREGGAHLDVRAFMEMFKIEDAPRNRHEVVEFCRGGDEAPPAGQGDYSAQPAGT